jgi:hypothetical protein
VSITRILLNKEKKISWLFSTVLKESFISMVYRIANHIFREAVPKIRIVGTVFQSLMFTATKSARWWRHSYLFLENRMPRLKLHKPTIQFSRRKIVANRQDTGKMSP